MLLEQRGAGAEEAEGPEPVRSHHSHASGDLTLLHFVLGAKIRRSLLSENVNRSVWSGVFCNVDTTVLLQGFCLSWAINFSIILQSQQDVILSVYLVYILFVLDIQDLVPFLDSRLFSNRYVDFLHVLFVTFHLFDKLLFLRCIFIDYIYKGIKLI